MLNLKKNPELIIYGLLLFFAMCLMLGVCNRCNKNKPAPSTDSNAKYESLEDSLLIINHELIKAKERAVLDSVRIKKLESRDSMWMVKFQANRVSDEKLKMKQSGIRKQVENIKKDSLREIINNF